MRRELIVPPELPRVGVERHNRRGVQIVAFALGAVVVGARVPGAPIHQIELRIEAAGDPCRAAPMLPGLRVHPAPRSVTRIIGACRGVEAPDALSVSRVVRVDEPAHAVLPAGHADDHLVFHDERRGGRPIPFLEVFHRRVPQDRAALHADRHHPGIERRLEEPIAKHAEAAIDTAAAGDDAARHVAPVTPDLTAGAGVDRPAAILRSGDVNDTVEYERRGLELAQRLGLKRPLRREA